MTPGNIEDWPTSWASDTVLVAHDAFKDTKLKQTSPGHWSVQFTDADAYSASEDKIKRQQLSKAGARLAELLNRIWP